MNNPMIEKYHKNIIEQAMGGIALVDGDGKFLYVNAAFCEIVEYTKVELIGLDFSSITHPADILQDQEMAARVKAGIESEYTMAKRYLSKTGKTVWVRLNVRSLGENGAFEIFLSQILEIHDPSLKSLLDDMKEELIKSREINAALAVKASFWDGLGVFLKENWLKIILIIMTIGALIGMRGIAILAGGGGGTP